LLFTSDMLVEDIHFTRSTTSAYDLGRKSLAVNLSDVAAMGGRPVATLLSLSIPKDLDPTWAEEFMRGYHSLSARHNVALVGGDTTSSASQITINVTAIGRTSDSNIKRRSAAKVGDIIMTTGQLGNSAAGLRQLMRGEGDGVFVAAHRLPMARVAEGVWLGEQSGVHAMMDISDGVGSDIRHILSRSGVGAQIDLDKLPTQHDPRTALCGGEDYELLLTVSPSMASDILERFNAEFSMTLTPIGEITEGNSVVWRVAGEVIADDFMGFRHF
ncbi:MAG: thiamine-phosphate kinase, partial [Rikenellaceae bacterium]